MTIDTDQLVEMLSRSIPHKRLVTDRDVVASLSADDAEWAPVGEALLALRARDEAEVQEAVRVCADLRVPVVPRGAGTGLSGGANAVDCCLVLDLSRLDQVVEIDADNLVCVVQPGIVNDDLKAVLREQGLWYPPDPASAPWSTIGGNVATNAGGLCCLKYGVTRDYVLGMRAVMGGPAGYGTAVRLGRRTAKGVAGLDLCGLMVGSEGTLGVVTEVTLRLRPALAGTPRTIVGAFDNLVDAGVAVASVTRRGLTPYALELLDRECLTAVEEWKHLGLEAEAQVLLLARVDTPGEGGADEARGIVAAFEDGNPLWAVESSDDTEAEALFAARRLAYPALERARTGAHRGRVRAAVGGAGDAGAAARHREAARRPDGHHRARGRRQPAPAAAHPTRGRRGARGGSGRVRGDARRGHRPRRHGLRRARDRSAQARRDAPRARPRLDRPAAGGQGRRGPAEHLQPRQGLVSAGCLRGRRARDEPGPGRRVRDSQRGARSS